MLPTSTRRSLPMLLLKARELVMSRFRPMLREQDLTEQQWRVLRVLAEAETLDAAEAADRAAILGPSLTRIVKTLEARRLVVRGRDEVDGRRAELKITAAGRHLIESLTAQRTNILEAIEITHGLPEIEALLDRLEHFIEIESRHDASSINAVSQPRLQQVPDLGRR